mmetsp:Transcript_51159/g.91937  ORF Transcript_51159/g.91937 Transcript_51159/m.91937 type:complete len:115 (+) Transcript_51159:680-1024(+)
MEHAARRNVQLGALDGQTAGVFHTQSGRLMAVSLMSALLEALPAILDSSLAHAMLAFSRGLKASNLSLALTRDLVSEWIKILTACCWQTMNGKKLRVRDALLLGRHTTLCKGAS